jgi:hypothetical protein
MRLSSSRKQRNNLINIVKKSLHNRASGCGGLGLKPGGKLVALRDGATAVVFERVGGGYLIMVVEPRVFYRTRYAASAQRLEALIAVGAFPPHNGANLDITMLRTEADIDIALDALVAAEARIRANGAGDLVPLAAE